MTIAFRSLLFLSMAPLSMTVTGSGVDLADCCADDGAAADGDDEDDGRED
jgi:hypothetical protein